MKPYQILIPYTYIRSDKGVALKNLLDFDSFGLSVDPTQLALVRIDAGGLGGNHRHPRQEIFHCPTNNLTLVWQNRNFQSQEMAMDAEVDNKLAFYLIPSMLPHVVVNRSKRPGILIEYASGPQIDVEPVTIIA